MEDNKNFILFAVISLAILLGFNMFYLGPKKEMAQQEYLEQQQQLGQQDPTGQLDAPQSAVPTTGPVATPTSAADELALADAGTVKIETPELFGTLSLRGARFDDLWLVNHKTSMEDDAENIQLLNKFGGADAYYVAFNWQAPAGAEGTIPDETTAWVADSDMLTPGNPVTLSWTNEFGAKFLMEVAVDDRFMFTVTQSVVNVTGGQMMTLAPGAQIRRVGIPKTDGMFILHEGLIGVFDKELSEISYDDVKDGEEISQATVGGWLGFTDKFWMTTLVPNNEDAAQRARLSVYTDKLGQDVFYADYSQNWAAVKAGESLETVNRFYAGAKIVEDLDRYEAQYQVQDFNKAIDWGWFHFLTRPIFTGLHWLFEVTGNYGVAILLMTVLLKLILYPLANKSYVSMSHMKKAQPKIKAIQERYKEDRMKMQQEMAALYKSEKINPMASCLPMIPQMFIFFALYKTLYVTIEMRHQPFMGWITDLSAADPLTPLNLFGLIPWDPPSMIAVGVLPILMGLSMYLQQKLNPQQASMDETQQKIMNMLPLIFTFIMAQFSAGLVLYWTWNNVLSIAQQWVIMRREDARMAAEGK
jgi:YidC/Oxa1 family membrane protein insertase